MLQKCLQQRLRYSNVCGSCSMGLEMMWERTGRGYVLVAGLAVLLYLNSLPGEFVFDDHEAIENNMDVRTDTPLSVLLSNDFWGFSLSSNESHKSFRPLSTLSFRWNRQLHGMWAPGFHLVNVSLHALTSCLYLLVCLRLLTSYQTAVMAALLFAAHPIHTEAVANIVGRTELLCGVFFLLSLLSYQQTSISRQKGKVGEGSTFRAYVWLILSVFFSILSLLSKEQGITVLGVCVAYELFVAMDVNVMECLVACARILGTRTLRLSLEWRRSMKRVTLMVASGVVILSARLYINGRGPPLFVESDNPASFSTHWLTRTLTYTYLCGLNMWLLICPSRLCFDWSMGSIPLLESLTDSRNGLTLASMILFAALLVQTGEPQTCHDHDFLHTFSLPSTLSSLGGCHNRARPKNHILDNNNIISSGNNNNCNNSNNNNNNNNNNNTSISSMSMLATPPCQQDSPVVSKRRHFSSYPTSRKTHQVVLFASSLLVLPFLPASNLLFPVGFVVGERILYLPSMGACLLVAMGAEYLSQCHLINRRTLKAAVQILVCVTMVMYSSKTVRRNYEWRNTQLLAESALPVNHGNAKVFMTIGNVYAQQGVRKCEVFYREAIRLRPNYTTAWTNLGLVLLNTERSSEAESCYRTALSIKENHINANINMGHLCRLQQRWEEAKHYYLVALSRRSENPMVLYSLGVVMGKMGSPSDMMESEALLRRCLKLFPNHADALISLARLLANTTSSGKHVQYGYSIGSRVKESIQLYRLGLQLQSNPEAHYELGRLLLMKKELREAESELLLAVKSSPKHARAHYELGNTLKELGERRKARYHYEISLQLDPSLALANTRLHELDQQ